MCVYYLDKLDYLQGSYSHKCLRVSPHLALHTCEHTAQALHRLKHVYKYSVSMDDCSYLSTPVSFSFFASVCLLAVEILLSISVLVIADTIDAKTYTHVILASYTMRTMLISFDLPLVLCCLQMSMAQTQHRQHISSVTIPLPTPTTA